MTSTALPELSTAVQPNSVRFDRQTGLIAAGLSIATFAVFARSIAFQFIDFDDPEYVINNVNVHRGLTLPALRWSLTAVVGGNYSPLTMWAEMLIGTLFGAGPGGFHLVNVVLHAASVGLAFLFFVRAGVQTWVAAALAAMWGWHPLRVESVAWVSELKDTLCTYFWLLTMLCYFRYVRAPRVSSYLVVFLAYSAALASKPMATTLPFVLLLLDVFPLRRFAAKRPLYKSIVIAIAEKFPLLLLGAVLSRITLNVQHGSVQNFSPSVRLTNAMISVVDYLRDTLWPTRLSVFYPHPSLIGQTVNGPWTAVSATVIALISTLAIFAAVKRRPEMIVGWLWFIGTLVPVIGLVQVGAQSRADRYTYIPTLGLMLSAGWLISIWVAGARQRQWVGRTLAAIFFAIAGALVVCTQTQLAYWTNSDTLFRHAIDVTNNNYVAYAELANVRLHDGMAVEALAYARRATAIHADKFTLVTEGLALVHMNQNSEALGAFTKAIRVDPKDAVLRRHTGNLLYILGRNSDAEKQFQRSIQLDADDAESHDSYAALLASENRMSEAAKQWSAAVSIDPKLADAQAGLAKLAYRHGDVESAILHYRTALRYAKPPADSQWALDLAWLEATSPSSSTGEIDDAVGRASGAIPNEASASALELDTLAAALARAGQSDRAAAVARRGVQAAEKQNNMNLARSIRNRLDLYLVGRPYISGR